MADVPVHGRRSLLTHVFVGRRVKNDVVLSAEAGRVASVFRAGGRSVARIIDQYAGHMVSPELEASALQWLNYTSAQRAT